MLMDGGSAAARWLSSSVDMLRVALDLQHSGKLAPELLLWATENPNVNPPEHLITKASHALALARLEYN